TESQALIWANHNLKEQCELLELLLMYFKDFEADTDIFISLLNKFKVKLCLQRLTYYTEYLDNNQPNDLVKLCLQRLIYYTEYLDNNQPNDLVNLCLQRLTYYTEYLDNNQPNDLVKLCLQRLTYYTEYLDNNQPNDLLPTEQTSVFRLTNDKKPYEPYGDLILISDLIYNKLL
ncbi:hypothetical protein LOTGIDRAFT_176697, partial [Lottia gigantea]